MMARGHEGAWGAALKNVNASKALRQPDPLDPHNIYKIYIYTNL